MLRRSASALADPRPAYAAADIVLGMGHSGLRGMAFAKPVVVVGERGFSLPVTAETADHFFHHGVYGVGDGDDVAPRLAGQLRVLLADRELRESLGEFGRRTVLSRYGLDPAADRLEEIYRGALRRRSWRDWLLDTGAVATPYLSGKLRRLRSRIAAR